jgi:hypothetical protein
MLNDMCVLAPATLIAPTVAWEPAGDGHSVRAAFTNAGRTIRAELFFNESGELVDFRSDDRYRLLPDGKPVIARWSTPISAYRSFGPFHLAGQGDARWHDRDGEVPYIELTIDSIEYNVESR